MAVPPTPGAISGEVAKDIIMVLKYLWDTDKQGWRNALHGAIIGGVTGLGAMLEGLTVLSQVTLYPLYRAI